MLMMGKISELAKNAEHHIARATIAKVSSLIKENQSTVNDRTGCSFISHI
jgi:hypothetical protein